MKVLPRSGFPRHAVLFIYVVVVMIALLLLFEFVVNRKLLPSNF
jgi:hypothetical protein